MMWSSSRCEAPALGMKLEGLEDEVFDGEHHRHEAEAVAQNGANVEELEIVGDRVTDPVRPAEELDHENDLPDERQTRAGGSQDEWRKLRQEQVAHPVDE